MANILSSALWRRTAESAAEQTHRMLEAVIEGTSDMIFVKDLEERFVVINAPAAAMLGLPAEQILGRTLHEVFPADVAELMAASDQLTLERGVVERYEEPVVLSGELREHRAAAAPR